MIKVECCLCCFALWQRRYSALDWVKPKTAVSHFTNLKYCFADKMSFLGQTKAREYYLTLSWTPLTINWIQPQPGCWLKIWVIFSIIIIEAMLFLFSKGVKFMKLVPNTFFIFIANKGYTNDTDIVSTFYSLVTKSVLTFCVMFTKRIMELIWHLVS